MPTEIDMKLAEDLAEFRLETAERFGSIDEKLGAQRGDFREFRAEQQARLAVIKWAGTCFAWVLVFLVPSLVNVAWNAGSIVNDVRSQGPSLEELTTEVKTLGPSLEELTTEVKAQGGRLDHVEKRLDELDAKLDILIRRGEPGTKGG